jgi:hypothetical protein
MPLRNHLPQEYEHILSSVINGSEQYQNMLNLMFAELNPSCASPISQEMREALWLIESSNSGRWRTKSRRGEQLILKALDAQPDCAVLFSVSGNGYLREKAVKKWRRVNSSFELALLLIRLNDWAEQVRSAAIIKLEKLIQLPVTISGLTNKNVMGCMDLILNPNRFGRSLEVEFRVLNQLLNINGIPLALTEHITHSAVDSAPRYFILCLKRGILADALPTFVKQGRHSEVRRIATKALLNGGYTWNANGKIQEKVINHKIDCTEIAAYALSDKSPTVQCVALSYITEFKPATLYKESTYRGFVYDKRPSIFERAFYGLKSLGIDYVGELRQKVLYGEIHIHLLEVLGRYGTISDGDLIFSKIDKVPDYHKVRALSAAAKLKHVPSIDALEKITFDSHNNVTARAAAKALCTVTYVPNFCSIIRSIRDGKNVCSRGYVRLIRKLPTMQLALAISELNIANVELDYTNLWQLLAKKRNMGAFLPSEKELTQLSYNVNSAQNLKETYYKVLGVKL